MDFKKHDARTAAEKPHVVRLRHPATGFYIMNDATDGMDEDFCAVMVVGSQARSVQAGILDDARAKLNVARSKKKKAEQSAALEDIQKTLVEGAARVIRGFEYIERDGEPLTTSKADIEWFLDLNFVSVKSLMATDDEEGDGEEVWRGDSFAQQILTASNDSGLYLGE